MMFLVLEYLGSMQAVEDLIEQVAAEVGSFVFCLRTRVATCVAKAVATSPLSLRSDLTDKEKKPSGLVPSNLFGLGDSIWR
jgi:hypothetical protein